MNTVITTRNIQPRGVALRLAVLGLIAGTAMIGGCRGDRSEKPPRQFFPGLDDQPKMKAQTRNTVWEEFEAKKENASDWGRTARLPVQGTVPYGREPHTGALVGYEMQDGEAVIRTVDFARRESFLALDPVVNTGKQVDGTLVERIPVTVDRAMIELGRQQYEINCLVCHGGTGKGDGVVGTRWAYPLPNFQDEVWQLGALTAEGQPLTTAFDGHIFDIIRNGKVNDASPSGYAMPPYGARLTTEETWAIVAYIRTLQQTQRGTIEDLRQYNPSAADELMRNVGQTPGENPNGGEQ